MNITEKDVRKHFAKLMDDGDKVRDSADLATLIGYTLLLLAETLVISSKGSYPIEHWIGMCISAYTVAKESTEDVTKKLYMSAESDMVH